MKKTNLYLSFEELYHDANKIGLKLLNSEHTIDIANFITEVKHLTFKPDLEGKYQIDASNPLSFMQPSHLTAINKYLKEIKERKPESEFINEGNKVIARIYFFKWLSEKYKITPPSKVTRTGTVNSLNEIVIISSEDSVYNNFFTLDIYKEFLREYNQTKKIELINHEAETIKNELYVGIRKENDSQGQDDSDDKSRTKTPTFTNNFDNIKPTEIYKHFKAGLVEKGYLTEQELNEYLKAAFELQTIPETLFKLKHTPTKQKIYTVFYVYYKDISQKKHERQKEYAALLGDFFEGYKTEIIQTNWARDYKTKR